MDFDKYDQDGNIIPEKYIEKIREIRELILKDKPGLYDSDLERLIKRRVSECNKTKN